MLKNVCIVLLLTVLVLGAIKATVWFSVMSFLILPMPWMIMVGNAFSFFLEFGLLPTLSVGIMLILLRIQKKDLSDG